ncbi:DUF1700 domain-containing protein [Secundilactobacillus folii]|nr:DUF1700 domain-containing protein [Secundilactobacillus folii]
MDKYISEFKAYLGQLSAEEREEVVNFYSEYLQDGGFETYDSAVNELGSPKHLARKVLADYSIRLLDSPIRNSSSSHHKPGSVRTIWLIILGILSTPVTIPLAIGAVALLFGVLIGVFSLILAIVATVIGVLIGGLVALFAGIGVIGQSLSTGLVYFGGGLAVVGIFIAMIPFFNWLIRGLVHVVLSFSRWLYGKLSRRNRAEERRDRK